MQLQFTPYVLPVAASAVLLAVLALIAWHSRHAPGARAFSLLMLAMAEWSAGYALELTSHGFSAALFWDNIAWVGASVAPTFWLVFALHYTGRARWLTRQYLAFLAVEPLITLLLVWTNGPRGIVEQVSLDTSSPFWTLHVSYGMWYWIDVAYSYVLVFLGAFVLCSFILAAARSTHFYCVQGACLLLAIAAPWAGNFLTLFGFNPLPYLNLTPFAFLISGLAFSVGLFIFRLLDLVPIAREIVIESMREVTIVLDAQNRVLDLNPTARRLIDCKASKAIGRSFADVFQGWPELVEHCCSQEAMDEDVIAREESEATRYFGLRITPLNRRNGHLSALGRLIILNDITGRIQDERALKESEGRFRNIFSEIPIGMAIVDLQDHMLQVNKAFREMLGYSEQELIGNTLAAITHPDDVEQDTVLAGKALSGEISSYKVEKRYVKKNLEILWADMSATILRNQHGEPIYGLVMLENIIERKRARLLEEERHHVAYELHDGLAQVAVSAHQHLQALASHYHPRSPRARQELEQAIELAQRSVREARRLIAGLRPTVLDDFGLATALRLQIEAQRDNGWTVTFEEALGPLRLSPAIETTLFGVAQEALTNVQKHAHTSLVRLLLERREERIRLEVQDWGRGFEAGTLRRAACPGERVGIRGMQERVELVGGHLTISSQPGEGTLVVAEVPIPSPNGKETLESHPAYGLRPGFTQSGYKELSPAVHSSGHKEYKV